MKILFFEIGRQEISIALIIIFGMVAMFFLGYHMAYNTAIDYANEQIVELSKDNSMQKNLFYIGDGSKIKNVSYGELYGK